MYIHVLEIHATLKIQFKFITIVVRRMPFQPSIPHTPTPLAVPYAMASRAYVKPPPTGDLESLKCANKERKRRNSLALSHPSPNNANAPSKACTTLISAPQENHQRVRHKFKHSHRISQCIRFASKPSSLFCVNAIRVRSRLLARSSSCTLIVLAHAPKISPHPRHSSHMPSSTVLNASMRFANCVSRSAQSYSSSRTEGSISRSPV